MDRVSVHGDKSSESDFIHNIIVEVEGADASNSTTLCIKCIKRIFFLYAC